MLNYLYSELWRVFHRPLGRVYFIFCLGIPALFNLLIAVANWSFRLAKPLCSNEALLPIIAMSPLLGACFLIPIADLSFGDETRLGTFKNAVGFGISRSIIYWGKFISSILISLISLGFLLASYFVTSFLLPWQNEYAGKVIGELFATLCYSLPIWLGVLATLHMFYFVFRNGILVIFGAAAGFFPVLMLFSALNGPIADLFKWLLNHSIIVLMIDVLMAPTRSLLPGFEGLPGLGYTWLISLIHITLFLLPGYAIFMGREIR